MAEIEKTESINCPIGKWYFKRMTMLGVLLLGFCAWFIYDGKVKYPRQAFEAVAFEAFEMGGDDKTWEEYQKIDETKLAKSELSDEQMVDIKAAHTAGASKAPWRDYAVDTKIDQAEPAEGETNHDLFKAFSAGGAEGAAWAEFAEANGLSVDPVQDKAGERAVEVMKAFEEGGKARDWTLYAEEKDWPAKAHFHSPSDISQQIFIGSACGIGGLAVFLVMILNRKRAVSADAEAYFPKPSQRVPYDKVFKIDTRKWRRKGLAYAYYKEGEDEKKAVLDDLKFVGSQAILDRMVDSFEGEIIEEVIEEDEDEDGDEDTKEDGDDSVEKVKKDVEEDADASDSDPDINLKKDAEADSEDSGSDSSEKAG